MVNRGLNRDSVTGALPWSDASLDEYETYAEVIDWVLRVTHQSMHSLPYSSYKTIEQLLPTIHEMSY